MKRFVLLLALLGGLYNVSLCAPIKLTAEPLWGSRIAQGEPVLLQVKFSNPTAKTQTLSVGDDVYPGQGSVYIAVYDERGQLLSSPAPTGTGGGLSAIRKLTAGQTLRQTFLATDWYRFDRSGKYSVRVQLLAPRSTTSYQAPLPVLGQHTVQIEVGPADDARLKTKCEELYAWAYWQGREASAIRRDYRLKDVPQPMSHTVAMRALLSVRSEVALPYFVRLVEAKYYSTGACLSLLRLRTPRATKIVKEFANRRDTIGKAARQAQKMSLLETPITYTNRHIVD